MYSLNCLIITIKLLVIMSANAAHTASLSRSVINSARDINQQLTQQHAAALSTITSTTSAISTNSFRLRKRHRKRHSIWFDYYNNNNNNENSTMLEWSNPCGGEYHPNAKQPKRPTRKEQKRIYNNLKHTALNDFNYLNGSYQQDIDISNIEIWWLHNGTYKFLPKLKMNSSIALKRWYRNMQTYVASFAYLHRIQFKYDRSKSQRESNTSQELKELLKSSRNMLCELETAVNKTYTAKNRQIPHTTRLQMNKRLKLRTKQRFKDDPNILAETDSIDLKFVKFHYFEYLKSMWQLLKKFNKRQVQMATQRHNKRQQTIQKQQQLQHLHLRRQQQQQQQQQQTNSSTQFNEVEKCSNRSQTKRNKKRTNSKIKHKLV